MGTRADFYVGRGESAEWLGSIAWDGDAGSVFAGDELMLDNAVRIEESDWRKWVADFIGARSDGTTPECGWPWPWDDSRTTDYAYAWDAGKVYGSGFGREWWMLDSSNDALGEPDYDAPKTAIFPNMKGRKNVTYGPRSGVIVIGI